MTIIGSNEWYAQKEINVFDVEAFIDNVHAKFLGTIYEESREALRTLFDKVLSMPRGGDKSLYPNAEGRKAPASLEVWLKAGDFRRYGYRLGDTLMTDQHGIVLTAAGIEKIKAAKAEITTAEGATEGTQNERNTESGTTAHTANNEPSQAATEATSPAIPATGRPISDGTTATPFAASDFSDATDDYNPGVTVPEIDFNTPSRTTRRRNRRTATTGTPTPSTVAQTANQSSIFNLQSLIINKKTLRSIAAGIGTLAALVIVLKCGLIIPFAILGGMVTGIIK